MNSDDFISRARNTVLENLLNPQFGVVMLAKEMGISRSELYKRIKAIKNKSASQFIREIRLERALELIKTESYSFGEIAYMVGFSSPTYFSTSFKDYFGYSPSVSKQNGNVPKSEKIPKTKNRTIPLVLGAIAILILAFWSLGALGGSKSEKQNSVDLSVNRRTSLKAYKLYVEARELGEQRKDSSLPKAIGLLEEAVALDPSFAEAYAELSFLYGQWHYYGSLKKQERDKMMKKYTQRAMELDPESAEVLLAKADLAWKNRVFPRDSSMITEAFQSVLDKDPENDRAHYRMYQVYRSLGQYETSHAHLIKSSALEPQNYFYKTVLARDLFWKKNEREKAMEMIEEVISNSDRPGGLYFKSLFLAESSRDGHVQAFKNFHKALKVSPFLYGYMYWNSMISLDLDLVPMAKKYSQLIQIRYPENTYYTYEPAFALCIAEGRYEDALDLTIIWQVNKGLQEDLALARIAKVYLLKGNTDKSKRILLDQFTGLYDSIESGNYGPECIRNSDIEPIRTYVEVLRMQEEHRKADVFADFLCSYYEKYYDRNSISKKFDPLDCFYLQNNLDGFIGLARQTFFKEKNRLAFYRNLKCSKYAAFEDNPEFLELYNNIEKEMQQMRAEVIAYLKAEGDWDPAWDKSLNADEGDVALR
ncbi:MAG: helix-turn-helix domain-containing protein [Flavobacteriaceae bacterium]|nr:helix-turn-helix domain-containing protein [Muriicola sp.]NNL39378.1 helix-turn-helix domain-containing protein [Flavobacteriaceae bacterium]